MGEPLRAPFPWFGGKSRAAPLLWEAFGDGVANYVEPFAGSLATLLARRQPGAVETVNDKDTYLANFWRAVRRAPDEVAYWAARPVNEADLHATHRWLVEGESREARLSRGNLAALQALAEGNSALAQELLRGAMLADRPLGAEFRERMRREDAYFDPEVAGRWVWGLCLWIGSGWCAQPSWEAAGRGVHAKGQREGGLSNSLQWEGRGHAGAKPRGMHGLRQQSQQKPMSSGQGVLASGRRDAVREWMRALAHRLRYVRVCCGDWKRVVTPAVTTGIGVTAVLMDPPYSAEAGRDGQIYAEEDLAVAHAARKWAVENGGNPSLRIALCGYEGEHELPATWRCVPWKAAGGYANRGGGGNENAGRERIWLSPHCLEPRQGSLFPRAVAGG